MLGCLILEGWVTGVVLVLVGYTLSVIVPGLVSVVFQRTKCLVEED